MMRLASWNCNMAFRKKKDKILDLDPDLLVIQECESPDMKGEWGEFSDWIWMGEDEHKGLVVFSRNGISLSGGAVSKSGGSFSIPISTDTSINLLGIWAMNDEEDPENRYISQVYTTLKEYGDWIDEDTVIAGDFNWNAIWDESPDYPLRGTLSDTVRLLNEHGLQSAYHQVNDLDFGKEAKPTFYMHKKQDRGYHTDYIFLDSGKIAPDFGISLGKYDKWIDYSDHMPLLADTE